MVDGSFAAESITGVVEAINLLDIPTTKGIVVDFDFWKHWQDNDDDDNNNNCKNENDNALFTSIYKRLQSRIHQVP